MPEIYFVDSAFQCKNELSAPMKLRIQGNSIRLRLTQSEVEEIGKGNTVSEAVSFGKQSPVFHYALAPDGKSRSIQAQYHEHTLQIILPSTQAQAWANTDQVGMEREIPVDGSQSLYVLIEKDFQCLHQRPREDEHDNFPNPRAEKA